MKDIDKLQKKVESYVISQKNQARLGWQFLD